MNAIALGPSRTTATGRANGRIILTGYLGEAGTTHARIRTPLFTHTLFGVCIGLIAWDGPYLRTPTLRALFARRD